MLDSEPTSGEDRTLSKVASLEATTSPWRVEIFAGQRTFYKTSRLDSSKNPDDMKDKE